MQQNILNHPKLAVSVRTGAEGPKHDPYSFQEVTVRVPAGHVVIHNGLGEWMKFNGKLVEPPPLIRKIGVELGFTIGEKVERIWRNEAFTNIVGFSPEQIQRIARKKNSICRACGTKGTHAERGYPGESFEVCDGCGMIRESYFDESAIM